MIPKVELEDESLIGERMMQEAIDVESPEEDIEGEWSFLG